MKNQGKNSANYSLKKFNQLFTQKFSQLFTQKFKKWHRLLLFSCLDFFFFLEKRVWALLIDHSVRKLFDKLKTSLLLSGPQNLLVGWLKIVHWKLKLNEFVFGTSVKNQDFRFLLNLLLEKTSGHGYLGAERASCLMNTHWNTVSSNRQS